MFYFKYLFYIFEFLQSKPWVKTFEREALVELIGLLEPWYFSAECEGPFTIILGLKQRLKSPNNGYFGWKMGFFEPRPVLEAS